MVQSVELVLDEQLDAAVRAEWDALARAGLPSQARHTGPSNAPHVTLAVAEEIDADGEAALRDLSLAPGGPIRLGGLLVFPGRTLVLARLVVPSAALLVAHGAVQDVVRRLPGRPPHLEADTWTPHVTLARRLEPHRLPDALHALADRPRELVGTIAGVRRWDGDARRTWALDAQDQDAGPRHRA